jgi:Secretion system C-terminal sorting domain
MMNGNKSQALRQQFWKTRLSSLFNTTQHNTCLFMKTQIYLILFFLSISMCYSQNCSDPNNDTNSLGGFGTTGKEPLSIDVPKSKSEVYFVTAPTFKEMLGVNVGTGQGQRIKNIQGIGIDNINHYINDVFSHIRVYSPSNKDFFTNQSGSAQVTKPRADQIPFGNTFLPNDPSTPEPSRSNLRILVDAQNKPLERIGATTLQGRFFIQPKEDVNGNITLVKVPTSTYPTALANHYVNYMNGNYINAVDIYQRYNKPVTLALNVDVSLISSMSGDDYKFPYGWFRQDAGIQDWGIMNNISSIKKHAKAYAMMLARIYSPKLTDCDCPQIADVIEIGNEPYGFYVNASNYNAIVEGFIEGINQYYGSEIARKIKLVGGAFQANHSESSAIPGSGANTDISGGDWKDYVNVRIPASAKCNLSGINTHPYSFDFDNSYLLTAYPEKVSNTGIARNNFLRIRNSWQWLKDNAMNERNIYASEFGWDSEECNTTNGVKPGVGKITQAIYTIRNLFMMGRYGVKKATLYEAIDDDDANKQCGYAYHRSGVWNTNDQSKYIFKALHKFVLKAGDLKFHYALKEEHSPNGTYAYILEDAAGQPKYMVAWRAMDINDQPNTQNIGQLITGKQANLPIDISFLSQSFMPDVANAASWFQLDGENNTPLTPSIYNPSEGVFMLSPVPILIPIRNICSDNTFTPSTVTGTKTIVTGTTMVSQNDITVASGATLTVNGKLIMANNKNLIVQSGGTLNVIGGTITNACNGLWGGIDAFSANINLNNATIEHALDGITNNNASTITALNTTFLNNQRDIEYLDKPISPNNSFQNCTFKVNDAYRSSSMRSRVTLWNSQGVKFEGCDFVNQFSSPLAITGNLEYDWQGIYAVASSVEVNKFAEKRSTFTNFYAGIRTVNYGATNEAIVKYSDFDKNFAGIISDNVGSITIQKNKFTVRWANSFPNYDWYRTGLLINTGSGYTVNSNEFIGIGNGGGEYTFGTLILRTGEAENRIEGNKYTGLYVGNRIIGNNRNDNQNDPTGLQLLCSDHSSGVEDHAVQADWWDSNSGIRLKQGSSGDPDGNQFSNNGGGFDIWTDTQGFERFYQSSLPRSAATISGPVSQTPTLSTSSCNPFVMFTGGGGGSQTGLALLPYSPETINQLTTAFEEMTTGLEAGRQELTTLLDGGNQTTLLGNIRSQWNRDTATLRTNLLAQSPNLSETVLLEVAKLNVLNKKALMQILLANPSSSKGQKFLRTVQRDMPNLLTDTEIQQLNNAPTGRSKRVDLEEIINRNSSQRAEAAKLLIHNYLTNPEKNKEELRYWWGRLGSRHAQYNLAETYIKDRDNGRYEASLRNMSRDLVYSDLLVKENQDYVDLYSIKSQIFKSGRSLKNLTTDEIGRIRRIANNTDADAAVQANNILCFAIGECKKLVIPRLVDNSEPIQGLIANNVNNSAKNSTDKFKVYPNPAHDNFVTEYQLSKEFGVAYISLMDIAGREIMRQTIPTKQGQIIWQTEQLKIGLYFISVIVDNHTTWQAKVSVQK